MLQSNKKLPETFYSSPMRNVWSVLCNRRQKL